VTPPLWLFVQSHGVVIYWSAVNMMMMVVTVMIWIIYTIMIMMASPSLLGVLTLVELVIDGRHVSILSA
jgi:hypothetical protein